ncbi:hypothetical protein OG225_40735 (plasmid) [Nocardia sp. NBC_01377]|uniref:hypothetical protein n=1 Tax=Nocardia sp. NBC_01377 TaxID=2903595 RepID=UPI002F909B32
MTIDQPERDIDSAQREWLAAIYEFQHRGYLQKAAPDAGVHDDYAGANPDDALDTLIADRIGSRALWSPQPSNWEEMNFFDLVEIFHDLVARPRRHFFHNFDGCGWHYSVLTPRPAQILYRWTINRILARNGVELRLAESGEDVGRLVEGTNDARSDLIEAALAAPDPPVRIPSLTPSHSSAVAAHPHHRLADLPRRAHLLLPQLDVRKVA